MKTILRLTPLTLFLLCLATPPPTAARTTVASAVQGVYQFTLGDRYIKYAEFDAQGADDGSATGSIYLSDEATIVLKDVDGTGEPQEKVPGFYIRASVDGLVVEKNQAVLSGVVRESSYTPLIGRRVLLTVEDNGDNTKVADRLTWGIYQPLSRDWTPSDAELKDDPGVGLTWWAKDAERRDDVGYAMPRSESIDARAFPVASYAFADVQDAAGDIIVRP